MFTLAHAMYASFLDEGMSLLLADTIVPFPTHYLRTVPTIVIAYTLCASRDTWISYG